MPPLPKARRHLFSAGFLAAGLLLTGPVVADASPESAEALRAATQGWLDRHLLQSERMEALEFEAAIAIEEEEPEGWRIELPPSRLHLAAEGGSLRLAAGSLRLIPREDGLLELSWQLPTAIRHLPADAEAEADVGLEIARQAGSGTYAPDYGSFLAFDALLGGLALSLPEGADLTVEELGLRGDSRPRDADNGTAASSAVLFDSSGTGHLQRLAFQGGPTRLGLEALQLDATLDGLQLDAYAEAVAGLAVGDTAAPQFFSFAEPLFEAGAVGLDLSGLVFEVGPQSLVLERGEAAVAVDGLQGTRSAIVLRLALDELQVGPLPPLTQGLLPRRLLLDLELLGVPNAALGDLLQQFSTVAAAAGTRYAAGLGLPDLWQLLQRAGAELRLAALRWDSALLRLEGDALLNPSSDAALGFFGQLQFEIEGLPQLLEQLRGERQAQRILQLLTLVQGLGIPLDPAQPAGARRYSVVATTDGRLEVNGTDVMPLLPSGRR